MVCILHPVPLNDKVYLTFNFILDTFPTYTFVVNDELLVLKMSTISPATNTELKLGLWIRFKGGSTWRPVFKTEGVEIELSAINIRSTTWYVTAGLGISNADMQVVTRLDWNSAQASEKNFLALAEAWDFTNQKVKITYFSETETGPLFLHGKVARIDYVGGYFDTGTNIAADERVLSWMLPGSLKSPRHHLLAGLHRPRSHAVLHKQGEWNCWADYQRVHQPL
jgi:hypothetical protein